MIGGTPNSSRLRWLVAGLAALFMVWPSKAAAEEPGAEESAPVPLARLRARRWVPLLICIAAVVALLLWVVYAPSPAVAAGWLIGCLFWLSIAVGALVLIAVHALTGGRGRRWRRRQPPFRSSCCLACQSPLSCTCCFPGWTPPPARTSRRPI